MHKLRILTNVLVTIIAFGVTVTAQTLFSRTFVSATGNDASSSCSRIAPCQTFAGALGKTARNGEINCLDPGGFGPVLITKSVTIDCEDNQGSILASSGIGIEINLRGDPADPKHFVKLRGITINGSAAGTRGGSQGILVSNGNTLPITVHVDQVAIDNFTLEGILFNGSGGELVVRNSVMQNNGTVGVLVNSNSSSVVNAKIENSSFIHNQQGVRAETAARVSVYNCNISNNSLNGVVAFPNGATQTEMNLYNCLIASNRQFGVFSGTQAGSTAIVRLDGNHIVNNFGIAGAAGVSIQGGQVLSRGNNTINGNTANVSGGTLGSIPSQ
jgi:hypothetical protein